MTVSDQKDERIARLKTDPRFIRPKKKQSKLQVDARFKPMFEAEDFQTPFKVDKYGRKVKETAAEAKDLKRFYRIEDEEEDDKGKEKVSSEEDEDEVSSSASEGSSSSDDESEDDLQQPGDESVVHILDESLAQHPLVIRDVPMGAATSRLAIVNIDWDQIKAIDLFQMMEAFKPPTGVVKSVKIYPSQFGRERMAKEAIEGPPQDIFKPKDVASESDSAESESEEAEVSGGSENDSSNESEEEEEESEEEEEGDENELEPLRPVMNEEGEDFNEIQLRKYQLERLRYYYAVVECDSVETASTIYRHCDGTEFEMSANFMDLRFIPDEVTFDEDVPTDEATHGVKNYKPKTDMITPALQHSKVKLTWDLDDPDRSRITRVNLAKFSHEDNDLKAYLASASSADEDDSEDEDKVAKAARMRELLLAGNDANVFGRKSHEDNDDLQITFTSGFDNAKLLQDDDEGEIHMEATFSASDNDGDEEEEKRQLTLEEYKRPDETLFEARLRRQRETKKAKKEARLAKIEAIKAEERQKEEARRREAKKAKRSQSERALDDADTEDEQDRADEEAAGVQKTKKKWKVVRREKKADDFAVKLDDDRFKAIYEEPSFSLDPTHPSFKPTKGNKELIRERQRRLK